MRIAETYLSIQGEGLLTGTESVFVRAGGCNLRCWYCDTPYASWQPEGDDAPIGCIHLIADGKIVDSKWITTTGDEIQNAAEIALTAMISDRNKNPDPVPTHLLSITTKWLCFKFTVQSP